MSSRIKTLGGCLLILIYSCDSYISEPVKSLNLCCCNALTEWVFLDSIGVRFKLPKHIAKDRSPWDKNTFFFQIIDYPNDIDRMGIISVEKIDSYPTDKKTSIKELVFQKDMCFSDITIKRSYIETKKQENMIIGYSHFIYLDTSYNKKYIKGTIVFTKDNIFKGKISLRKEIIDSTDIKFDWMDCVYNSIEVYQKSPT